MCRGSLLAWCSASNGSIHCFSNSIGVSCGDELHMVRDTTCSRYRNESKACSGKSHPLWDHHTHSTLLRPFVKRFEGERQGFSILQRQAPFLNLPINTQPTKVTLRLDSLPERLVCTLPSQRCLD